MEGINQITDASETIDKLRHMYSHCLYRFEFNDGCDGCSYNDGGDPKDACGLLRISDDIRKFTAMPLGETHVICKVGLEKSGWID